VTKRREIVVDAAGAGQRLDRYLAGLGTSGTRSHIQRLVSAGHIRLDGATVKSGVILRIGQTIAVDDPGLELPAGAAPEAIPLDILHEDEWLLVVNKPPGLVVHPAPGHWRGTLVNALLHHWKSPPAGLDPQRPGIVHRLDRDTSGVLVIAKDPFTLASLGAQFKDRTVEKQYLAMVWGRMRSAHGTITQPIARHPVQRKRMAIRAGGRESVTAFEVVERYDEITVVRLFPRTGRTHQIRVHLAAYGHPIVGDLLYGRQRSREGHVLIARQALHAERLTFRHPHTDARVRYTAPLPEDMANVRRRLRRAA
jgi:23S rRNA pseudouridine1911/1915/1917 synthase